MDVDHDSAQPEHDTTSRPPTSQTSPVNHVPSTASPTSPEAGPSRRRSSSSTHNNKDRPTSPTVEPSTPDPSSSSSTIPRHASPETALTPNRPSTPHLDLATYPTPTLLRLLANLLQQIATSNDHLRPDLEDEDEDMDNSHTSTSESRSTSSLPNHPSPTTALFDAPSDKPPSSLLDEPLPLFSASRTSLSHPSSLLSFHARHVPSISIEAYLLRILKYCPTTNEVFLGLLVYFDRMSRLGTPSGVGGEAAGARRGVGRGFAIDSFNVHRLVIAGVTVASKFFSDVFYTNSRYAKVGGLPSHELNQLELQFLLLNDFRLVIPPDEMQRYGDRLLGYWESREAEERGVASPRQDKMEVDPAEANGEETRAVDAEKSGSGSGSGSGRRRSPATKKLEVDAQPQPQLSPRRVEYRSNSTIVQPVPTPATQASTSLRKESEAKTASPSVSFAEPPRPRHARRESSSAIRSWAGGPPGGIEAGAGEAVAAE